MEEYGTSQKIHSTKWKKRDIFVLYSFFLAYYKYNCDSLITLEIKEDDYHDYKNARESYETIMETLKMIEEGE